MKGNSYGFKGGVLRLGMSMMVLAVQACMVPSPRVPTVDEKSQADAQIDKGVLLLRQGRTEEAQAAFTVAYELSGTVAALDGLGCVALLEGRPEEALSYFESVVDQDPGYAPVYGNLAFLYESAGRLEEAKVLYMRALELDPANFRVRNNHAAMLYDADAKQIGSGPNRGELSEEARNELLRAHSLAPHPKVFSNLLSIADNNEEKE